MRADEGTGTIMLPLSDKMRSFLDDLANDDIFREQLVADPASALAGRGIDVPSHLIPTTVSVPSREALNALLDPEAREEALIPDRWCPDILPDVICFWCGIAFLAAAERPKPA